MIKVSEYRTHQPSTVIGALCRMQVYCGMVRQADNLPPPKKKKKNMEKKGSVSQCYATSRLHNDESKPDVFWKFDLFK